MAKFIIYLVVVSVAAFFRCSSAATLRHSRSNRSLFAEHITRVNSFACSQPQPRAMRPEQLGLNVSSDESLYPSSTVLSRCSCAGFCANADQTCSASETETVELVFRVKNHVNGLNSSDEYRRVSAINETACSCQPTNQIK
ncbi:hypothetical protein L9F63_005238 [Diploptera punctata]|uniref:Uncharacterized protein n=1 Tax=Diploptera punctata TaxID=6984 RepID=A0AAD7ZD66_DIPPU|nr:hypothetical protein L9F63_005238 [Diploptera punctata]